LVERLNKPVQASVPTTTRRRTIDHGDRGEIFGDNNMNDDDHTDPYLDFPSHDLSSNIIGGYDHDDGEDGDDDDEDEEGRSENLYYDNARVGNDRRASSGHHRRNVVVRGIIDARESASRRCTFSRLGYLISIILMAWTLALIVVTKKESSQLSPVLVDSLESTTGVSSEGSFSQITEPCASFYLHMIPDKFGNETHWTVARYDGIENTPPTFDGDFTSQNYTLVSSGGPYNFRDDFFVNDNEVTIDTNRYEMIEATTCLPVGIYVFSLNDEGGDGICCDYGHGEYGIQISTDHVIRPLSLGKFTGTRLDTSFVVTAMDVDRYPPLSLPSVIDENDLPLQSTDSSHTDIDPPAAPTSSPCAEISMHLVLDQFGNETSWEIILPSEEEMAGYETSSLGDILHQALTDILESNPPTDASTWNPTYYPSSSSSSNKFMLYAKDGEEFTVLSGNSFHTLAPTPQFDERHTQGSTLRTTVMSGGPYSFQDDFENEASKSHYNAIIEEMCLPIGSYEFVLYDESSDGICCDYGRGEYGIEFTNGRVIRPISRGVFSGSSEVTPFDVTAEDVNVFAASMSAEVTIDPSHDANQLDMLNNSSVLNSMDDSGLSDAVPYHMTTVENSLDSFVTVPDIDVTTGRGKSYGILYDVVNTHDSSSLVIVSMDLYIDTTSATHYEVWTKQGSWQDVVQIEDPDYLEGFRQVFSGSITGKGPSEFTRIAIQDFENVRIGGGQRQTFYVTSRDNNLIYTINEGGGVSRHDVGRNVVQASSKEFDLYFGAAVRTYPLENADPTTDFWFNAGFLGRVWFETMPLE
jgi:hypothetical protein